MIASALDFVMPSTTDKLPAPSLSDLRKRRKEILDCARNRGAYNVRVFGSVARGDQSDSSDVDILVEFESDRSLLDHGGLLMDLRELLGCSVDVVSERGLRPRFRENALRDAVPL